MNRMLLVMLLLCTFSFNLDSAIETQNPHIQEAQDELLKMDQLIKATEDSLVRLKSLRSLLAEYKKSEVIAVKNPNDTDNLLKLIDLAKQINDVIDEQAMQDYFSPQFLEEIKKFSEISLKKNIPQAK